MSTYAFDASKLRQPDWSGGKKPAVLVSCGSFSPITFLHLRMFEMARDQLNSSGWDVLGAFASPVADAYGKKDLASADDRFEMVRLALESSDWIALDRWEGLKSEWTRTRVTLEHFQAQVDAACGTHNGQQVRVQLLCGSDLLDSFNTPNLWAVDDMTAILQRFGVCVIERDTNATSEVIFGNDLLYANREHIAMVKQHVANDISSTKIRLCLRRGLSIKYLTPDPVIAYLQRRNLYTKQ
jgi:nicotinamide mononucleotide adenylyltransferase